jgi:putative peptide zinc metalloprotease protein
MSPGIPLVAEPPRLTALAEEKRRAIMQRSVRREIPAGTLAGTGAAISEVARFLGEKSPFAGQPPEVLSWLAFRFQNIRYDAGDVIIRQGDPGDAFYILRRGRVSVLVARSDASTYQVSILVPGDCFGEQSIMTGDPRSATVVALEPVDVLRLSRPEFEIVLDKCKDRVRYFTVLTLQRQRPKRADHCVVEHQRMGSDKQVYIIKDNLRHQYLKLSEEGAFLWKLMDGQHTVRDLCLAYLTQFGRVSVVDVLNAITQMGSAGFVQIQRIGLPGAGRAKIGPFPLSRTAISVSLTTWYYSFRNVDRWLSASYRWVGPIYSMLVQSMLIGCAAAGAAVFGLRFVQAGPSEMVSLSASVPVIFVSLLVHAIFHELAHALTCKHFGREVHRAGIGWYYFNPVAFVDTSDIWLAPRRARILVSAAGPFANLVMSGVASLTAICFAFNKLHSPLWYFSFIGYLLVVVNLNPLLELDGYYILMDWLEVPNLRSKALAYLGSLIRGRSDISINPKLRRIFMWFGAMCLGYGSLLAVIVLMTYRRYLSGFSNHWVAPQYAEATGWLLGITMMWLILYKLLRALQLGADGIRETYMTEPLSRKRRDPMQAKSRFNRLICQRIRLSPAERHRGDG